MTIAVESGGERDAFEFRYRCESQEIQHRLHGNKNGSRIMAVQTYTASQRTST